MINNSEIVVDLPRSNCKLICQEYKNDNWKIFFQNKENNTIKTIERSFTTNEMKDASLFIITTAGQNGTYKNAHEAFMQIKNELKSIKGNYVQTKSIRNRV